MPITNDLRRRLRRLGVQRGAKELPPPRATPQLPKQDSVPVPIESLINGREVKTQAGSYFLIETIYDLDHRHGSRALGDWLETHLLTVSQLTKSTLDDLSKFAFFDIETTGLAGGAGTLAFLIGVGVIEDDHYVLRQYFLRDPSEEVALLIGLRELLQDRIALITYNGRSFDVPIVETRFVMSRQRSQLNTLINFDLLPFARRLWRGQYENCSLGTLERAVLGCERTEQDTPGMLIPQMYVDYLRTGDAREMMRVIYHNAEDILSMTALASHIVDIFADPFTPKRSGYEVLRLGMWHDDQARVEEAETAYRAAQQRPLTDEAALVLYQRYGVFLKKQNRRAEAVSLWVSWSELDPTDPEPCIELAKFYEWEAKDIAQAKEWASRALMCLSHWRKDWRREEVWNEVRHRLERLKKK